jgi:hypothetical protein
MIRKCGLHSQGILDRIRYSFVRNNLGCAVGQSLKFSLSTNCGILVIYWMGG